jgi:hypothetical protein
MTEMEQRYQEFIENPDHITGSLSSPMHIFQNCNEASTKVELPFTVNIDGYGSLRRDPDLLSFPRRRSEDTVRAKYLELEIADRRDLRSMTDQVYNAALSGLGLLKDPRGSSRKDDSWGPLIIAQKIGPDQASQALTAVMTQLDRVVKTLADTTDIHRRLLELECLCVGYEEIRKDQHLAELANRNNSLPVDPRQSSVAIPTINVLTSQIMRATVQGLAQNHLARVAGDLYGEMAIRLACLNKAGIHALPFWPEFDSALCAVIVA